MTMTRKSAKKKKSRPAAEPGPAVIRINEIIERLQQYRAQANVEVVEKAYVWSAKLHAGALRDSGAPYLSHPLEVAGILTQLKMDESSIAAGLLHDVIEDSNATVELLRKEFGPEIARLVDGVTKIGKITDASSRIEAQAENLRKMILAMAQDVRVILIKLADRLHNMQTIDFLKEEERRNRIARETMEIYAPLAARLGIHWIQAQLEDLSFKTLSPELYARLAEQVNRTIERKQEYVEEVQNILARLLEKEGIKAEVTGRFKHLYSIQQKMERQKISFDQVYDLVAFRILVNTVNECYDALRIIHSSFIPVPGRIKDYIALPKSNMYRSIHTSVIGPRGERMEIQIRTHEMHAIAEYGIAAHWRYKELGNSLPDTKKALKFVDHLLEFHEQLKDPYRFLESVKSEVIPEEIIVFTPKGDLVELPAGATPVDFAYAIHSDIGDHCGGAKVNGKIVPLNQELQSGDMVEIITSKTVEPSPAWLEIVKTPRARARISHWIATKEAEKAREKARSELEAELLPYGLKMKELLESGKLEEVAKRYSFPSVNRMLESVGFGKFPTRKIISKLVPPEELRRKARPSKKQAKPSKSRKGKPEKPAATAAPSIAPDESSDELAPPPLVVRDFQDPSFVIADCCSPLTEEEVVAFAKENGTMELHRADCPKIMKAHPDRLRAARWAEAVEGEGTAGLEVISEDRRGMLASISSAISDQGINILRATAHTTPDHKAIHTFRLAAKKVSQLTALMNAIAKIEGVISVRRI